MKNNISKFGAWVVILTCLTILTTPIASYASDAESMRKLRLIVRYLKSEDAGCRDKANGEYLSSGNSYRVKTKLYKGSTYIIAGAGDSTVRDLDIIIYDQNFNKITKDTKTDSTPMVSFSPRWSGTFYIKVKMYSGYGYSNVVICYK